jgi:hypothetical protein
MARRELFEYKGAVIRELKQSLHPLLQHELIMESMNEIPHILFASYFMDNPADPEALGRVYHHVFWNLAILVLTIKTEVEDVKFHPTHHVRSRKRVRPKTSSKSRDDDEYEGEEEEEKEEPSSDDALPKRRKKASSSAGVRR